MVYLASLVDAQKLLRGMGKKIGNRLRDLELLLRENICMYLHVGVLAERDLVVVALRIAPAWFLVEGGLRMALAFLLNSYLDEGVLALWDLV